MPDYIYLGDKMTDPALRGRGCHAIRRPDGKCIRGKTGGGMLVEFDNGRRAVVIGRLLRRVRR